MFFSPGCFAVPQTQQTNSVCQIQLRFIPSLVAGIKGQTFIRQATELSNYIPKTNEQQQKKNKHYVRLYLGEEQEGGGNTERFSLKITLKHLPSLEPPE